MVVVTLTDITKTRVRCFAADDLSMLIRNGKFTVLVGPSGRGKITTPHMIVGLETATVGEIGIDERVTAKAPPKDRNIMMILQNHALHPQGDVISQSPFLPAILPSVIQDYVFFWLLGAVSAKLNES